MGTTQRCAFSLGSSSQSAHNRDAVTEMSLQRSSSSYAVYAVYPVYPAYPTYTGKQ